MPAEAVTVRMFGMLRDERREAGLPLEARIEVPGEGLPAAEIASGLGLPLERIEGVFRNGKIGPVDQLVVPGDTIAFVPYGTPGPHRFFLGLYDAGRAEDE